MMWLRQHFFSVTLVFLLTFVTFISYTRFMVLGDYVVRYEGACDPYTESCFIGCDDDECTEQYYYSLVEKYAPNVEARCGTDITDCDAASECLPEDGDRCEITYCNQAIDGEDSCERLTESDFNEEGTELEMTESEEIEEEEGVEMTEGEGAAELEGVESSQLLEEVEAL